MVTPSGVSPISAADQFTYVAPPVISGISAAAGPTAGGTKVTITGTDFTSNAQVNFGTTPATTVVFDSPTRITATSPAGAAATVAVSVTTAGGVSAATPADRFTYANVAPPAITGIGPAAGPTAGGTWVLISGTNLAGATAVDFGSTPAAAIFPMYFGAAGTQIWALAPAGAAGAVDVTVSTAGGISQTSSADQFSYMAVTGLSPAAGPLAGGTTVTITGTGFTGATAVNFGTTAAISFTISSATQIIAKSPGESAGTVDVTVVSPGGVSAVSLANQFTYMAAPAVTGLATATGPAAGGTSVMITGTGFTAATAVNFGAVAASKWSILSATQMEATSPGGTGMVNVTVVTPGGTSAVSSANQFTYEPPPVNKLTASDGAAFDEFGYPGCGVSISGNTMVVAAPHANGGQGAVYVFTESGSTWTQTAKLTASDAAADGWFGGSVSISGNTVVIGAEGARSATTATRERSTYLRSPAPLGPRPPSSPCPMAVKATASALRFRSAITPWWSVRRAPPSAATPTKGRLTFSRSQHPVGRT